MTNKNKINHCQITKEIISIYIAITILTLIITISVANNNINANNNIVWGQNQQEQQEQIKDNLSKSDIRTLKITFDSITINKDHDPLFSGEWLLHSYVNNVWTPLWLGSKGVDNGQNIPLNISLKVNVTNNSTGELRISTVGFENDIGYEQLPVFTELLDMDIPFIVYAGITHEIADKFTLFDVNDPIGIVVKQFTIAQNFGIGEHEVCSEKNLVQFSQGSCDYTLKFHIEDIKQ